MIEIAQDNTINIRELITTGTGDDALNRYHRRSTNSTMDLTCETDLVVKIAGEFPLSKDVHPDGNHRDISLIKIDPSRPYEFRYDISIHSVENGETVCSERKPPIIVDCLEDLSVHPAKVQKVGALLFDTHVKVEFIANLPRVDIPAFKNGRFETKVIDIPAKTQNVFIEGQGLKSIEIKPAFKQTVQATKSLIQYKGKLYEYL